MTDCIVTTPETLLRDEGPPCVIRGAHRVEHEDGEECAGCLPAPATDDGLTCAWCRDITRDRLKGAIPGPGRDRPRTIPSLAELYEALGEAPVGHRGDGADAQVIGDQRRQARSAIKAMLVSWCLLLAESPSNGGRGLSVPDEEVIRRQTAMAIFRADAETLELDTYADEAADEGDPRTADLHRRANERRKHAAQLRETYLSGADVIAALCEHVDRHLSWLLNHPDHADQLVNDVTNAWTSAWSLAGGGRNVPTLECECGTRVPMPLSEDAGERETQEFVCPSCGNWGVLAWWAARVGGNPGPMRLADIPPWLAQWHGLNVTLETLRHWSKGRVIRGAHLDNCRGEKRGECAGCARTAPDIEPAAEKDAEGNPLPVPGKGAARRYDPHAVALVALRKAEERRLRSA